MLDLINRFSFSDQGNNPEINVLRNLSHSYEWSQYVANWPITLKALRKLWELGKVSQLKTPFYDPLKKIAKK